MQRLQLSRVGEYPTQPSRLLPPVHYFISPFRSARQTHSSIYTHPTTLCFFDKRAIHIHKAYAVTANFDAMVEYTPPPEDLSRLNPIQRYMQKGELDWNDYYWLIGVVLLYVLVRPAIQKFFKWAMGGDTTEEQGGQEREAYYQRRAKVGPNSIRGGRDEPVDMDLGAAEVTTSGASLNDKGAVSNRKAKGPKGEKSEADKLLDWDDEPSRGPAAGDKSDIMQWLDRWDKEAS